jgi:molybdopterin-binding protein
MARYCASYVNYASVTCAPRPSSSTPNAHDQWRRRRRQRGVSCRHSIERLEDTMKLSARNQLKGKIVEVRKGQTTAHVRIDVGGGLVITSSITNEAVDDLGLKAGDAAWAVIKASDVMIGK